MCIYIYIYKSIKLNRKIKQNIYKIEDKIWLLSGLSHCPCKNSCMPNKIILIKCQIARACVQNIP